MENELRTSLNQMSALSDKPPEKIKASTLYEVVSSGGGIELVCRWSGGLLDNYTNIFPMEINKTQYLICYSPDSSDADAFEIVAENPLLRQTQSKLTFGPGWDILEPFVLGNRQYIMSYRKQNGQFGFFEVNEELAASAPYRFVHT